MDLVCVALIQDSIPMLNVCVQGVDSIHGYVEMFLIG